MAGYQALPTSICILLCSKLLHLTWPSEGVSTITGSKPTELSTAAQTVGREPDEPMSDEAILLDMRKLMMVLGVPKSDEWPQQSTSITGISGWISLVVPSCHFFR